MDILASFLQGQQAGQQARQYRNEQNNLAKMEALAPRIVRGDMGAYAEAAAIDPAKANAYQDANDAQVRKLKGFVDYVNGARKSGNAAAVNAALQQGAPFITQLTGKPAPTEWTPDMDAGWAQLEAQVAMLGADPAQNTLHSQKIGEDGFIYNTYRDGRTVSTGIKADRQMWLRDFPGMDPQLVGKDGSILLVGQQGPQQVGAPSQAAPQRSDMEADIELANSMIAAGIPEAQVDAFLAQRGQRAGPAAVASQPIMAGGSGLARPSAAQEAAATEAAKQAVQLQYLPAELAMRSEAAVNQAVGIERGKAAVEQAAAAPAAIETMQSSIKVIDELLDDPDLGTIVGMGSVNPLNYIPGSKARGLIARAEQISGKAFLAAFNQLKGAGAITEKEGEAATRAMARLDRSQSLEDYRTALADLRAAIAPGLARQRQVLARGQAGQAQPQSAGAPRVQTPDDYARLPSGATYIAPDGSVRRKK